jgi:hypothetical protein
VNWRVAGVLLSLVVARRLRLDAHQILGALQNLVVRRNLGVRRAQLRRRVLRIRPVLSEWDALAEALQRIGPFRLFRPGRQGSAVPRPKVRMPACDRRLVCRAASRSQLLPPEEPEERSTLCRQVAVRSEALPCAAVPAQRPLRRWWTRRQWSQPSLPLPRELHEWSLLWALSPH